MTETQEAKPYPDLLPCPFCGNSHALSIEAASALFWDEDDGPYPHTESYAVICDAHKPAGPGGCGGQSGFKATEELAVAEWNRRPDATVALRAAAPDEDAIEALVQIALYGDRGNSRGIRAQIKETLAAISQSSGKEG
ncbi:hypothetical protein [uncultured Ramlibacter sp.]|uniref:hypothetical protein n=1 Tax=uncultured Ramlibacter sp. TaxID=260755 RepID=UPI00263567AB|nr:hypothetical protein [uncultured Ramlibacter sp.]